jgi:hypothetical protein
MRQEIDISKLPQTPAICQRILSLMDKRQGQLADEWGIDRTTLNRTIARMKQGKTLTKKTWSRFANYYMECLEVKKQVESYLNS